MLGSVLPIVLPILAVVGLIWIVATDRRFYRKWHPDDD